MTVKELMAAFKTSRRSLSTRPLHYRTVAELNKAVNEEHNHNMASIEQPPAPLAHRTVTDAESHDRVEQLLADNSRKSVEAARALQARRERENAEAAKPARTRKPTPCKCSCNEAAPRRACSPADPCGHKGCGLAAE